jgi:hypothetical protein
MRRNEATKKGEDVEYLRQSHNLSNNLLGKATPNAQPTLFEDWAAQLTDDERAKCLDEKIELIGFDLLASEQRAVEAVLKLVARNSYQTTKLKFGLNEWLEAYGVEKFLNEKKGWLNQSGKEREQALRALETVGLRSGVILYSRRKPNGNYDVIRSIGPLWKIDEGFQDLSEEEKSTLQTGKVTPQIAAKLKAFIVTVNEVFFCDPETPYFYKPADLWNRMQTALGAGSRTPAHTYNFLTWLFSQAGLQRGHHNPAEPLTLSISFDDLARQCRLHSELAAGRRKRITESFEKDARIAKDMQLLIAYELNDPHAMTFTFNAETVFADIEDWNHRQQAKLTSKAKPVRSKRLDPIDISNMLPSQLRQFIKETQEKMDRIKGLRKFGYDPSTGENHALLKDNSPEEKEALVTLQTRHAEAKQRLYGTAM